MGSAAAKSSCVATAINNGQQWGRWNVDMREPRLFFCWCNTQGMFSHHSLGFSFADGSVTKYLKAEIVYTPSGVGGKELVLNFTGPEHRGTLLDLSDYQKARMNGFEADANDVKNMCEEIFHDFGDYNEFDNNCQHYVDKVLTKVDQMLKGKFKSFKDYAFLYKFPPGLGKCKIMALCTQHLESVTEREISNILLGNPPNPAKWLAMLESLEGKLHDERDGDQRALLCQYIDSLRKQMDEPEEVIVCQSSALTR